MTDRDQKQEHVVNLYLKHRPRKATLMLSTGFGKGRVAIKIARALQVDKVLILVNQDNLRDQMWKEEFAKMGLSQFYDESVETVNYQSAYRWTSQEKNLDDYFIIADEVDFAARTEQYAKFFDEYAHCNILGLTGFITEGKRLWFKEHLPLLYTYTAGQAQTDKVLNKIDFIFVKFDLSRNPKDLTVRYKQNGTEKKFTQSQNNAYDYNQKKVLENNQEKKILDAKHMQGFTSRKEYEDGVKRWKYLNDLYARKRADILLNNKASQKLVPLLVKHFMNQHPSNKIVVFSKRTAQSIAICGEDYVYNGAITAKKSEENFASFQAGDKRLLGVCDKLNRGANIDGLNIAIFETFSSSDTDAKQRLGRLMRLGPDDRATAIVLLPYYMREDQNRTYSVQETAQVAWARRMIRSSGLNAKDAQIWDYRTVKDD